MGNLTEEKARLIERIRENPVGFIENPKIGLGERLWAKEKEIFETVRDHKYISVKSCHSSGKTFSAGRVALWFNVAFKDSVVLSTAPTFKQLKNQLWSELRYSVANCGIEIPEPNKTDLSITEIWYSLGVSTDQIENLQGFHSKSGYVLVIVDEASGIDEKIFGAIDSLMTSEGAKLLLIGNPTSRVGSFYDSFRDESFKNISISAFDTPNFTEFGITEKDVKSGVWEEKVTDKYPRPYLITPNWVSEMVRKHGIEGYAYRVRCLGEFPVQDKDTYIAANLVEDAIERDLAAIGVKELGVDPARFGNDSTGFCLRQGQKVLKLWSRPQRNEMEIAGEVMALLRSQEGIKVVKIDTIGVGAGVYDRLNELKYTEMEPVLQDVQLVEFKSSHKPRDQENYNSKGDEAWGNIKERLQKGEIDLPENEELKRQLTSRKYTFTSTGKVKLEPKESLKSRGLPSPDEADSLSLAFYPVFTEAERARTYIERDWLQIYSELTGVALEDLRKYLWIDINEDLGQFTWAVCGVSPPWKPLKSIYLLEVGSERFNPSRFNQRIKALYEEYAENFRYMGTSEKVWNGYVPERAKRQMLLPYIQSVRPKWDGDSIMTVSSLIEKGKVRFLESQKELMDELVQTPFGDSSKVNSVANCIRLVSEYGQEFSNLRSQSYSRV